MDKQDEEIKNLKRSGRFLLIFLIIAIVGLGITLINTIGITEDNIETTELLILSLDVSEYCAGEMNMTYQELVDDFLLNFTKELINNG